MKIFPTVVRKIYVTTVIVGGDEVTDERLTYDLPEIHPAPVHITTVDVRVDEAHPPLTEEGILAVLLEATETHPAGSEDVTGTEAQVQVNDSHPAPTHTTEIDAFVQETWPVATHTTEFEATVNESHALPSEDVSGTEAQFQVDETHAAPVDETTLFVVVLDESHRAGDDDLYVQSVGTTWPDTVVSSTTGGTGAAWSNTTGMTDKVTTSQALLTVSSGGLGGLTSQTGNGTLIVSAVAPGLSDLTITSVVLQYQWTAAIGGSATGLLGDNVNSATLEYSLNDGASWTTFETFSGQAPMDETNSVDITAVVNALGTPWNGIDQFRVRCFADCTSGAGVLTPATCRVGFAYARLAITAEKNYP